MTEIDHTITFFEWTVEVCVAIGIVLMLSFCGKVTVQAWREWRKKNRR